MMLVCWMKFDMIWWFFFLWFCQSVGCQFMLKLSSWLGLVLVYSDFCVVRVEGDSVGVMLEVCMSVVLVRRVVVVGVVSVCGDSVVVVDFVWQQCMVLLMVLFDSVVSFLMYRLVGVLVLVFMVVLFILCVCSLVVRKWLKLLLLMWEIMVVWMLVEVRVMVVFYLVLVREWWNV